MLCPHCRAENLAGIDECSSCGQSLTEFVPIGSELERSITSHSIDVLAPVKPVTITPQTTVHDAMREMVKHKIGCMVVVDDGCLRGILTERDILNKVTPDVARLNEPVENFMTSNPLTVTTKDSIAYTLQSMDMGGYRHMPVVADGGNVIGVISIRDILRFLCIRFAALRTS